MDARETDFSDRVNVRYNNVTAVNLPLTAVTEPQTTKKRSMIQIKQTVSERQEVSYTLLISTQRATHLIYS